MADPEKTEQPTDKRLREAREEGNIAKSKELPGSVLVIVAASFFYWYTPYFIDNILLMMREFMSIGKTNVDIDTVVAYFYLIVDFMIRTLGPVFAVFAAAAFAANIAVVKLNFSKKALIPKLNRIDPIQGAKKLFSKRSIVELLKSIFKIFVLGFVAITIVRSEIPQIVVLADSDPLDTMKFFALIVFEIFIKLGVLMFILSLIDFIYQKWQHVEDLKMSKQEVKEEHKQMEGDPLVKRRIRQAQREAARRRMMEDVPDSDVVVTNPTHFAVALTYNPEKHQAPSVIAKGQRLQAMRIIEIAKEKGILIHQDPPLARTLFKTVDIGDEIPENLYKAVAEILSMVEKFKKQY